MDVRDFSGLARAPGCSVALIKLSAHPYVEGRTSQKRVVEVECQFAYREKKVKNYTIRLVIPMALGLAAAGINWMMLASKAGTVQFVAATRDLEAGDPLTPADFEPIELPLQFAGLNATAIPYAEVGLLAGQVAQRALTRGDLLFFRDTTIRGLPLDRRDGEELFFVDISNVPVVPRLVRVGYYIWFRIPSDRGEGGDPLWAGPFRIVSVDSVIASDEQHATRQPEAVTVAYRRGESVPHDRQIDQLERFCDRQRLEKASLLSVRVRPTAD